MFDVVVGNPPFSKNLHLKIIDKAVRHLSEDGVSCFIHPARWYIDPLYKYKKNCDRLKFKYIVERLENIDIINVKDSCVLFNILVDYDIGISMFRKTVIDKECVKHSGFADEAMSIIMSYSIENNLDEHIEKNKIEGHRCIVNKIVLIGDIRHTTSNNINDRMRFCDIFSLKNKNVFYNGFNEEGIFWTDSMAKNQYTKEIGTPFPHSIEFKTKEEAVNFESSCRSVFYKNIVYLLKFNHDTPLKFLPWMQDYSHPWTDKDYCEFFGRLGMSKECQEWMCRDVYDYRVKDYIDYLDLSINKV
jgi:hypothetical protein